MSLVDPDDDGRLRYVVRHYRYDHARHERRHVVVAAFDNEVDFRDLIGELARRLSQDKAAGRADRREQISGVILRPGDQEAARSGRTPRRWISTKGRKADDG